MKLSIEELIDRELAALDKYELMALLVDFAYVHSVSLDYLADFIDNWPKHS